MGGTPAIARLGSLNPFCGTRFEGFGELHSLDRDCMARAVGADQVSALLQIPEAELEFVFRNIQQRLQVAKLRLGCSG